MDKLNDQLMEIRKRVIAARNSETRYADPDMFVGPMAGRFVHKRNVLALCERIIHVHGFQDFALMVVEEACLKHVAGGSHRMQAVIGVIPVDLIPYI